MNKEKEYTYGHTDEFVKKFGARLRELRKACGYSIDEACAALGAPRSTYAGWELGRRVPLTKSLSELAKLFDTTVDYLMLETDNPKPESNDIKERLLNDPTPIQWDGKNLSEDQATTIAAIIEAYLKGQK